jgi:segregation and condensation protein B
MDLENEKQPRSIAELVSIIEALIFVADEPLSVKILTDVLTESRETIEAAIKELEKEYETRGGALQVRQIAGGWQISTRAEYHEEIRLFLKTRPNAKLSLAALETLAVIAYKQPATVPEILEIRGVQSASAIKTLLDKKLIVSKGRKETVGRPMQYGTSKDFLIQFGLKDLNLSHTKYQKTFRVKAQEWVAVVVTRQDMQFINQVFQIWTKVGLVGLPKELWIINFVALDLILF